VLSLHSSNKPGELSQWPRHDDSIINIATGISVIIIVVHLTLGIQFNRFLRDALCKAGTAS